MTVDSFFFMAGYIMSMQLRSLFLYNPPPQLLNDTMEKDKANSNVQCILMTVSKRDF